MSDYTVDKVLLASDYPLITAERWLTDFKNLALRGEVRLLIVKENSMRLFKLA